jgi:uncharacterized protein
VKAYPINEFIIKAASRCNLNCDYCYEYNLGDDTWKSQPKLMNEETARVLGARIAEHASQHGLSNVFISFHGGEVLLLGPKRLEQICHILREQVGDATHLLFSMQTNATLLTERFVDVIQRQQIDVSVSIDGNGEAHDRHRVDHRGRGSYDRVLRGIHLLRDKAPDRLTGLLSVIDVLNDPIETLDAVASHGIQRIDFLLPHYHWDSSPPRPDGDPIAYGRWYWEIYGAWTADRHPGVEIRFLANIVSQLAGGPSLYEQMTLSPVTLVVISTDGSIEAVDSIKGTGSGAQQLGLNIHSVGFDAALHTDLVSIRQAGDAQLCQECRQCRYKRECAGGYFPHRWGRDRRFDNPSVYCADLYWLVSKIRDDLISRRKRRETPLNRAAK